MDSVSVTTSVKALRIAASLADISGGSTKLDISPNYLWNTQVSSKATFMMTGNTGVASMMAEDGGVTSMTAGGSDVVAIL